MATFSGFASGETGPVKVLYDIDLIKQDLLNEFYTIKGERLMDTEYGFVGWDLLFDLKTTGTRQIIENDARRIVKRDPRVIEQGISIIEEQHGYVVQIDLYFNEFATSEQLSLYFDNELIQSQQ